MGFIFFVFIFFIIAVLFGISLIGTVVRSIFSIKRRPTSHSGQYEYGDFRQQGSDYRSSANHTSDEEGTFSDNRKGRKRKKIFDKDEGEYVDFEEIKE